MKYPKSTSAYVIGTVGTLMIMIGCLVRDRPTLVIRLVLPNDFTGEVLVEQDSKNGEEYKIMYNARTGKHEVTLRFSEVRYNPTRCTLRLRDRRLFDGWVQYIVQYEDGTVLVDYTRDYYNPGYVWEDLGTILGSRDLGDGRSVGSTDMDGTVDRWQLERVPIRQGPDQSKCCNHGSAPQISIQS